MVCPDRFVLPIPPAADGVGGDQRSSERPTSARYSFPRQARGLREDSVSDAPGPAYYEYRDGFHSVSAIIGTARKESFVKECPYTENTIDQDEAENPQVILAVNDLRFPSARGAVFGTEERFSEGPTVFGADLIRASPDANYGKESPGLLYDPDYRRVRPSSAPAYSIGSARRDTSATVMAHGGRHAASELGAGPSRCSTARSASSSRCGYRSTASESMCRGHEVAFGRQRDSRRRTSRASSFSRASRFPAPKEACGELTFECKRTVDPCKRRAASATFGRATREGCARARVCAAPGDNQFGGRCGQPPRLPHPTVPPRSEVLRYAGRLPENRP
eukprot:TRINITY_DN26366_c0_g1_i1.p1 TRINITY_DN26366_c0_g1~~TRINITY_DN26366_c0_g1_i1.p1  ORF type:complete len:353 (+),score=50.48 TRINITY_DN26366_c0_g1_i1:60-1061(+)